jgi:hypothetical protein
MINADEADGVSATMKLVVQNLSAHRWPLLSMNGVAAIVHACAGAADPTSNHIYQRIGYRPVCDFTQYALKAPTRRQREDQSNSKVTISGNPSSTPMTR